MRGRLGLGLALAGLLLAAALVSLAWTPGDASGFHLAARLKSPPGAGLPAGAGLLGTDPLGRDVLSMLMVGARQSLGVALCAVTLGGGLGTLVGLVAAAWGGVPDAVLMRLCDALFAFPAVISALMVGALLGPGGVTAVIAIALFAVPVFARVARGSALSIAVRPYVLAARALGLGPARITFRHVLPNIAGPLLAQATLQLGLAILTEASLSFLGLGIPPPSPSWGRMLAEAQTYLAQAPWLALAPGSAIALAVLGFNLIGDGLAERADPRRRRRG